MAGLHGKSDGYDYPKYYELMIIFFTSNCPNTLPTPFPLLMWKYLAQIIYFKSTRLPFFILYHAKLIETNEETGSFSSFTQHELE